MKNNAELKKLGLAGSFAIYIPAAILMFGLTKYLIPYLSEFTGQETILFWFIVGGMGIFTPLIITGFLILKHEGFNITKQTLTERLRFRKITGRDLLWCFAGLFAVGVLSGLIMKGLEIAIGQFDHSPAFMSFEPLTKGRYWLLLVLVSVLDFKYTRRRISLAWCYVTTTGNCIWKICMADTWFWLGFISYSIWLAIVNNAYSLDFYSVVCCSENKKFMDWCNYARWLKRPKFYCNLFWINIDGWHPEVGCHPYLIYNLSLKICSIS
jgi:hypothetical protein